MYSLKLVKGMSYSNGSVKVSSKRPVVEVEDKATADRLIATGRFVQIAGDGGAEKAGGKNSEGGGSIAQFDAWTVAQLDAYAAENGIDLTGLTKKADKIAKIQQALADESDDGDGDGDGDDDDGELDYGEGN